MNEPRILALGDSYMSAAVFEDAFARAGIAADTATVSPIHASEDAGHLREYEGTPAETSQLVAGYDVVAFHAAPFSEAVFESNPGLRFLACARGGPVNVDLLAAKAAGVRVSTTPGKNAEAVADLTIGFLISLVRNLPASVSDVEGRASRGESVAESTFEGARWFGRELKSITLGLIGFGNVARLVAERALALGVTVAAFDPFVDPVSCPTEVRLVNSLEELLGENDVISIHARATTDNRHLIGEKEIAQMRPGSLLINTARESLVDEQALLNALRGGHLAGAAMDVNEADGPWSELVALPSFTLTPHLGGATFETLQRGADMAVAEISRFITDAPLRWEQ